MALSTPLNIWGFCCLFWCLVCFKSWIIFRLGVFYQFSHESRVKSFVSINKKKYMSHSKFFLIIKTCLNSTCILHQIDLTVPLLLPCLTLNGWKKHPTIKKRVAWYSSSTVQNIVVAHQVLWIIQLEVKLSSVAPVCVSDVKWLKRETKKQNERKTKQASKTTYRQITNAQRTQTKPDKSAHSWHRNTTTTVLEEAEFVASALRYDKTQHRYLSLLQPDAECISQSFPLSPPV